MHIIITIIILYILASILASLCINVVCILISNMHITTTLQFSIHTSQQYIIIFYACQSTLVILSILCIVYYAYVCMDFTVYSPSLVVQQQIYYTVCILYCAYELVVYILLARSINFIFYAYTVCLRYAYLPSTIPRVVPSVAYTCSTPRTIHSTCVQQMDGVSYA